MNTLKKDWKSTYGIGHILVTVKCLLIYPNPESALDEEAGKLLLEDYQAYASRAKLITSVHATPRTRPVEFDTPTASENSSEAAGPSSSTPQPPSQLSPSILPSSNRKSHSPALHTTTSLSTALTPSIPLISSPSSNKDSHNSNRDRHPSPSPLGTADANIHHDKTGAAAVLDKDKNKMGLVSTTTLSGPKAVKRAAASGGATNAEKRKKALRRL